MKTVDAGVLAVGYLEDGAPDGWPVVLSHGFPFDVHAYDEVVPLLTAHDIQRQQHAYGSDVEHAVWYQHLFQTERGRECLARDRRALCRMLWRQWSPNWHFDEATFGRTATSFDNPDFVEVVIHAYRHGFGLAAGDPAYEELEERLSRRPKIIVPAVTLDGASDTLKPGGTADQAGCSPPSTSTA